MLRSLLASGAAYVDYLFGALLGILLTSVALVVWALARPRKPWVGAVLGIILIILVLFVLYLVSPPAWYRVR